MHSPLFGYWAGCWINAGETILIHSSMKGAFRYLLPQSASENPRLIIDSLLDQVGDKETVVLLFFNFNFPNTRVFSILHHKWVLSQNMRDLVAKATKLATQCIHFLPLVSNQKNLKT